MKADRHGCKSSVVAWGISVLLVLPLAAALGCFAGWCLGAVGGQWLEYLGVTNTTAWGGRVGGLLGTILCPGYVAYRVIRDERTMTENPSQSRDDPAV